ncbi:MAG: hypothetical protein WCQ50_01085 [Spirochaetota bacterium]
MKSMKKSIAVLAVMAALGTFAFGQDMIEVTDTTTTTPTASAFQVPRLGETERIQSLATEYGLATTDIQAYLDQGYRIGDIDMALSIVKQSGKTLSEVIALGKAGDPASWISAGSSLGVTVSLPGKPEGAGKGQRGPHSEENISAASTGAGLSANIHGGQQSGQHNPAASMGGGSQGRQGAGGKH